MSFSAQPLTIRKAVVGDHRALANFLLDEINTHRHLDWRMPLEWLGAEPFVIAETNGHIQGVLACPPDPEHTYWIRLFSASDVFSIQRTWDELFDCALQSIPTGQSNILAAIVLQDWFEDLLRHSGFERRQDIVVLEWSEGLPDSETSPAGVIVRPMVQEDLPDIVEVDHAAFDPLWQNSVDGLQTAYDQSAYCTVAESEAGVIGYQISTAVGLSGHLARLAVNPAAQRAHIGYNLVRDMLAHFLNQGIWRVTVNTQSDNHASLTLYTKTNFHRTGEEFPVFVLAR
ncbi:MAG TPA: GNAT family N-acetyltransferase [Anaerolineaceae bacterium]|nr:GNAT family N-acetyltransferase [Anaerolineaceae bacterium]